MTDAMPLALPLVLVGFPVIWLLATAGLMASAGWNACSRRYPDSDEAPLASFKGKSGSMGPGGVFTRVNLNGILNFWILRSGLRVGLSRLFVPFSRPFVVPWEEMAVRRWRLLGFIPRARLMFQVGAIDIDAYLADRLARAAGSSWPEPGPFPMEPFGRSLLTIGGQWALMTALAIGVFMLAPRLIGGHAALPPVVAIVFPATMFGAVAFVRLFQRTQP